MFLNFCPIFRLSPPSLISRVPTIMAAYSADSSSTPASAHSGLGHVVPLWLLAAVFGALLLLTGLTVAVAHVDLGNMNLYLALGIATVKATLVVLFSCTCSGTALSTR